ncbi:MAG: hypothetical protein KGI98_00430 [Euryarchaeota archaeon]|nr:hypothetical protein [Euryarchaeota archaeon]
MARPGEPSVRPVFALVGSAILVLLALLSYFVAAGFQQQNSLYLSSGPLYTGGAGSAVVDPTSSEDTFLPNVPVNVTVTDLPAGATVYAFPCPTGVTNSTQCAKSAPSFIDSWTGNGDGHPVFLHFNVNVGHAFVLTTNAGRGAQVAYTAKVPLWALQTWVVVIVMIVGIVLVGVGLSRGHSSGSAASYGEPAGYSSPPLRRFCETCGSRFPDDMTMYCPSCGAPRM